MSPEFYTPSPLTSKAALSHRQWGKLAWPLILPLKLAYMTVLSDPLCQLGTFLCSTARWRIGAVKEAWMFLYCACAKWLLTYRPSFIPPTGIHHLVWSPAYLQPPDGVWRQGTPGAPGLFPGGLTAVGTTLLHPEPCLHRPGRWHK